MGAKIITVRIWLNSMESTLPVLMLMEMMVGILLN